MGGLIDQRLNSLKNQPHVWAVSKAGCDAHHSDPLTHLAATVGLYPRLASRLHEAAHELCSGRWLVVGGGGYDPVDVTPRAWTAFFGTVLGHETADVELPEDWIRASKRLGGNPPGRLLDDPGPALTPLAAEDLTALFARVQQTALVQLQRRLEGG